MQVIHNSSYVGQPVATVLAQLGLPAEALLKLRRRKKSVGGTSGRVVSTPEARNNLRREILNDLKSADGVTEVMSESIFSGGSPAPRRRNVPSSSSDNPACKKRSGGAWGSNAERSPPRHPGAGLDIGRSLPADSFSVHSKPEHFATDPSGISPGSDHLREDHAYCFGDGDDVMGTYVDVHPPATSELVEEGAILVLKCSRSTVTSFLGSTVSEGLEGLRILGANVRDLRAAGSELLELVLSGDDRFVGRCPDDERSASLVGQYGCRVVAVLPSSPPSVDSMMPSRADGFQLTVGRQPRWMKGGEYSAVVGEVAGDPQLPIAMSSDSPDMMESISCVRMNVVRQPLVPGDTVLVLAKQGFAEKWKESQEFDLVTKVGSLPPLVRTYDYFSLLVFCGMLGWVLVSGVSMVSVCIILLGRSFLRVKRLMQSVAHAALLVDVA